VTSELEDSAQLENPEDLQYVVESTRPLLRILHEKVKDTWVNLENKFAGVHTG
jgi:hypothetical protein